MKKVTELLALETRDQKRIVTLLLEDTGKLMENDVNKLEFFNVENKMFWKLVRISFARDYRLVERAWENYAQEVDHKDGESLYEAKPRRS